MGSWFCTLFDTIYLSFWLTICCIFSWLCPALWIAQKFVFNFSGFLRFHGLLNLFLGLWIESVSLGFHLDECQCRLSGAKPVTLYGLSYNQLCKNKSELYVALWVSQGIFLQNFVKKSSLCHVT